MNIRNVVVMALLGVATLTPGFYMLAARGTPTRVRVENISHCPVSYPADGLLLTKVPEGWRGEVDHRFDLHYASVMEGPPEQRVELIPEEQKVTEGVEAYYDGLDVNSKGAKWLSCGYGKLGELKLYRQLAAGIKRCTMKYRLDRMQDSYILESIDCKS